MTTIVKNEQDVRNNDETSEKPVLRRVDTITSTMSWENMCYAAMSVYSFPPIAVGVSRRCMRMHAQPNTIRTPPLT